MVVYTFWNVLPSFYGYTVEATNLSCIALVHAAMAVYRPHAQQPSLAAASLTRQKN